MQNDLSDDRASRNRTLDRIAVEALVAADQPRHLVDCDISEVDLSRLDLSGWIFERCALRHTRFDDARLAGSIWRSCKGAFAVFTGTDLSEASLFSSDFNNATFRRAILTAATVQGCKLTGADFSDARALDASFAETLLIDAKLPHWSFRKLTLNRIDFSQADLRKCDFRDVTFIDGSLRDAHMTGARFEGADLRGADIGGLRLMDAALFRGATISREQAGQLLSELGLNVR